MPKPSSLSWIAALVGVCAISYGLGNGWIRLGSPSHSAGGSLARAQGFVDAPAPGEFDPSALDGLEQPPEFRRSVLIDDRVRRTEGVTAAPAAETTTPAAAENAQTPANDPVLDAAAISKAIDDAANAVVTALGEKIKAGADRSNNEDALTQITAAAKSAAVAKFQTAVGTAQKKSEVDGWLTADATKSAAKQAADDAIAATSKKLAGVREILTDGDVVIKYAPPENGNGDKTDLPADGRIQHDGPEIEFTATVTMSYTKDDENDNKPAFDDTGATVTLELKPHSDSFKPYLKVNPSVSPPSGKDPVTLTVKTQESGAYDLVVTVKPVGRPALPPFKKSVVLAPKTITRPTIESLKSQDDRQVTFDLKGTSVIEVSSGRLEIGAKTSSQANRNLAMIDMSAEAVLTSRGGAPVVMSNAEANTAVTFLVTIPDADLTGQSKRIAIADLWTRETSNSLAITIGGAGDPPSRTVGISGRTGENAVFGEYTPPRELEDGFKPSDKVETRVVRLYYFRDAHRVAQIVNREVKSYNRVAVDTRRRMADAARDEADVLTDQRRIDEIVSIRGAQAARAAEQKVRQAQNDLDAAIRAENDARDQEPEIDRQLAASEQRDVDLQARIEALTARRDDAEKEDPKDEQKILGLTAAISQATSLRHEEAAVQSRLKQRKSDARAIIDGRKAETARIALDNARIDVEKARTTEAEQSDQRIRREQLEDRARENQFRQEVAAAHEDPDTYVPGNPRSIDPVLQVSVSVIGEGLIQLRGPIKGINVIRTMINQIDAPTSQVRVGIHTVQINGEHGDRIEKVATRIQDYVDHARFLTSQSAQMLRNAVVKVAAEKAQEAVMACPNFAAHVPGVPCPEDTQEARDARYQEAFFGSDFLNELRAIDSEFLMTGNKLLSLHSMDTTSLASALFLLALAKNDVRMQILDEFQLAMQVDLPAAEDNYYAAGAVGRPKRHHDEFKMFACNAKFQSFRGFFDAQVAGSETLNPLQREFLKLAQIFKSRLVTELEYDQRVKERGLLEDRIDPILDRKQARDAETQAQKDLIAALKAIQTLRGDATRAIASFQAQLGELRGRIERVWDESNDSLKLLSDSVTSTPGPADARALSPRPDLPLRTLPTSGEAKEQIQSVFEKIQDKLKAQPDVQRAIGIAPNATKSLIDNYIYKFGQDALIKLPEEIKPILPDAIIPTPPFRVPVPKPTKGDKDADKREGDGLGAISIPKDDQVSPALFDLQAVATIAQIEAQKRVDAEEMARTMLDEKQEKTLKDVNDGYARAHRRQKNAFFVLDGFKFEKVDQDAYDEAKRDFGSLPDNLDGLDSTTAGEKIKALLGVIDANRRFSEVIERRIDEIHQDNDLLFDRLSVGKPNTREVIEAWQRMKLRLRDTFRERPRADGPSSDGEVNSKTIDELDAKFKGLFTALANYDGQLKLRDITRRRLDQKRLLDMLIDDVEDKYIDLLEGTRSHTANIDAYIKRIATALDDDFNTQFYYPAFTEIRRASRFHDVQLGKIETTNVLANNRGFGKVEPQATMEFDLPKRDILINEAMNGALAMTKDFGALVNDPTFLAMAKLRSGQPTSSLAPGAGGGVNTVRSALPGLSRADDEQLFSQQGAGRTQFGSAMEALIPDPSVYKFETGTGFEIRPVVQPDGQSVVFHFNYMYTTHVREPVRADEKHLGRVKRHFIDTDVQLGNYELREVSRYQVALKASRTSRGVPLFEDIPGVGVLFRPLPSAESSLQENIVLGQSTIFPTLFDLMGLRWAPAVADLDTLRLRNDNYIVRGRYRDIQNRVFDISSGQVDEFLQIPPAERRSDLYRSQESIPDVHPNGYRGPGLNYRDSRMHEGYDPTVTNPQRGLIPSESRRANPRTPAPPPLPPGLSEEGVERFPDDYQGGVIEGATPGTAPHVMDPPGSPLGPDPIPSPPDSAESPFSNGERGAVMENSAPGAETGDRVASRPRIAPPRQYTIPPPTQRAPAVNSAPAHPAPALAPPGHPEPAVAPPGHPEPPLNGPAPVTSSASRTKDPAVGRAAFSQPTPEPQPKRQRLFTRMLGGSK